MEVRVVLWFHLHVCQSVFLDNLVGQMALSKFCHVLSQFSIPIVLTSGFTRDRYKDVQYRIGQVPLVNITGAAVSNSEPVKRVGILHLGMRLNN